MRTATDGWLVADRTGRRASWRLTDAGVRLLTEGTKRIYGFTAHRAEWDGRWLLILAKRFPWLDPVLPAALLPAGLERDARCCAVCRVACPLVTCGNGRLAAHHGAGLTSSGGFVGHRGS